MKLHSHTTCKGWYYPVLYGLLCSTIIVGEWRGVVTYILFCVFPPRYPILLEKRQSGWVVALLRQKNKINKNASALAGWRHDKHTTGALDQSLCCFVIEAIAAPASRVGSGMHSSSNSWQNKPLIHALHFSMDPNERASYLFRFEAVHGRYSPPLYITVPTVTAM